MSHSRAASTPKGDGPSHFRVPRFHMPGLLRRFGRFFLWIGRGLRGYVTCLVNPSLTRTRRVLYAVGGVLGATLMSGVGVLLLLLLTYPFTPSLKSIQQMKVQQPSVVLAASGEELRRFQRHNREWVALGQISPHVREALIATEDHRFPQHGGVDYRRLLASTVYSALGDRQGGSTITMQLARNLYPRRIGQSSTPVRKLKEIVTAFKIESAYEKDEILETYLNTVPFLYNAYGIEMASRTYFGKSARKLDVLESATLVGMLKATSYYNPVRSPERAQARRNVVLAQMVRHGALSADEFERLKAHPIRLNFQRQTSFGIRAPHFSEHVRRWLEAWAEGEGYDLQTAGLRIHTTLDWRMQVLAAEAVIRQSDALQDVADVEWGRRDERRLSESPHDYGRFKNQTQPFAHFWRAKSDLVDTFIRSTPHYRKAVRSGKEADAVLAELRGNTSFMDSLRAVKTRLETGFVAIDPRTGYVKAWVGSRSYAQDKFDHVAQARRQPGSTFKPFVYAAALEQGYKPDDTLPDAPVEIQLDDDRVWRPVNAGGFSGQPVTLRDGLAHSKNSISAQLISEVGPRRAVRMARRMGVNQSRLEAVPSLALGTSEVTLLEMVSSYATLASGGLYREPVFVTRIEDAEGSIIYEAPNHGRRAVSERTALTLVDMMRGVVDYGTGQRIRSVFGVRCDVAGKTGTTQDNADGWFLMMHPHLVAGSWVGFNDPRVTFRSDYWGQGAHNALYVVGDFYRHALRQGRLDPRPSLGPAPVYEPRETFFAQAGEWISGVFEGLGERFQQDEGETVAEARPQRPLERRPEPQVERAPEPPSRPRRERRRREQPRSDEWAEWEAAARDLGELVGEVGRILEARDEELAEIIEDQIEAYLDEAERYLEAQERHSGRRHRAERRRIERYVEDLLDQYRHELSREQRDELEDFIADVEREMRHW